MNEIALSDARALASWDRQLLAGPPDEEEAEAVFDAADFTDHLAGECYCVKPVDWLKPGERTAADLADLSTPQVLALLLDEHQPLVTIRAAQEVLLNRCKGLA